MSGVRPLNGFVFVEREQAPEKRGSIYVPDSAKTLPHRGVVIATGPGYHDDNGNFLPTRLEPGDRIVWDRMGAYDVPDMPTHAIVSAAYVLGVVEP